ncbi:tRNA wybutosine-synthesizing protein-like protein [Amylocarpus encephaloides]|uniref:tRNA wybutosine-synthesizing protein 2 n=1 Tax=Amylocarpus encephaloides TaxID=45428 RepID=A0A9P7YSZ0_9HELO|nr:tRNA wybutosine-synthesizing protein-like protein [Amylocarpus encephaloides]
MDKEKSTKLAAKQDRAKTPKLKPTNPIEDAITSWIPSLPAELAVRTQAIASELLKTAPKRWVVYPPMVLLPSGSFEGEAWMGVQHAARESIDEVWLKILTTVGRREGKGLLTHLAINNGIPLNYGGADENILRTPTGLRILYGDFGPSLSPSAIPTSEHFEEAFWVSARQNGITQIWAPRYTMFSRGNIKEKARILDFHHGTFGERKRGKELLKEEAAIDLYAGIGYFVFSYVKMGMSSVVGFELNPWSVEGLRRGALANGWSIRVVKDGEEWNSDGEMITIFQEDNAIALKRSQGATGSWLRKITHVNCGLLPSSDGSWDTALGFLTRGGWLHLHENVGVNDIDTRKGAIEAILSKNQRLRETEVKVEHVELVKTFAPGVWHCVFDVYVARR